MIPVVTPERMRAIDAAAADQVGVLIERAGAAVARAAIEMLGGTYGRTVAVLAGPGNNGADGRVAAERLRRRGVSVRVYDALDLPAALPAVELVIDAAFGTGFRGSWSPPAIGGASVLAVDVPTGLDATTGIAPRGVLAADRTVTFAAAKPGHVLGDGPDLVGELIVADIGLPIGEPRIGIVERDDVAGWVPPRARRAHKWHHAVRIVAGSPGMTGAAALVAGAAQRTGAGMVVVSSPGLDAAVHDARLPLEVVGRTVPRADWSGPVLSDLQRFRALVVGPGLGRDEAIVPSIVHTLTEAVVPVVIDGDGLYAIAWNEQGSPAFLSERGVPTVLTPHDGEFALLTGSPPGPDRVTAAHRLAEMCDCVVLLKGATTVVASPDHRTYLVVEGDERLATAGTGDVLAGMIAGLLAIGVPAPEAAAGGAWLHARAGAIMQRRGLVAGDLIGSIPDVLSECAP